MTPKLYSPTHAMYEPETHEGQWVAHKDYSELKDLYDFAVADWCDDDTLIRKLCEPIIGLEYIEGDSYGVPGMIEVVEKTIEKLQAEIKRISDIAVYRLGEREYAGMLVNELEEENERLRLQINMRPTKADLQWEIDELKQELIKYSE